MEAMVVVLLASHLICVNVASVAPLVAVWFERREASGDAVAGVWGRSLMWQAVALLLLGVALGLVIGVLSWNADYLDAIRMLRSKVHFGVWEILFSLALMLVQVAWWQRSPAPARIPRLSRGLLALLASTNLLYHFPVLMVVFARLVSGDDLASVPLDAAAFRQRLVDPVVLSRCVHVWFASIAVTGGWLIAWACWRDHAEGEATEHKRLAIWGARLALVPTLLQIPTGVWLLVALPPHIQTRLLGADLTASALFGLSIFLALWLMHLLAAIAFGDARRDQQFRAMMVMFVVVLLMSAVLRTLDDRTVQRPREGDAGAPTVTRHSGSWLVLAAPGTRPGAGR